jgi:outer membrane lipoprotein-sorting protein
VSLKTALTTFGVALALMASVGAQQEAPEGSKEAASAASRALDAFWKRESFLAEIRTFQNLERGPMQLTLAVREAYQKPDMYHSVIQTASGQTVEVFRKGNRVVVRDPQTKQWSGQTIPEGLTAGPLDVLKQFTAKTEGAVVSGEEIVRERECRVIRIALGAKDLAACRQTLTGGEAVNVLEMTCTLFVEAKNGALMKCVVEVIGEIVPARKVESKQPAGASSGEKPDEAVPTNKLTMRTEMDFLDPSQKPAVSPPAEAAKILDSAD